MEWRGGKWSGAEQSGGGGRGAERSGAERSGAERSGVEWSGAERSGLRRSARGAAGVVEVVRRSLCCPFTAATEESNGMASTAQAGTATWSPERCDSVAVATSDEFLSAEL